MRLPVDVVVNVGQNVFLLYQFVYLQKVHCP